MDEELLKEKWNDERKIQQIEQSIAEPEQRGRKGAIYIKILDDWLTIEEIGKILKGGLPLVYYHGATLRIFDNIIECGGIKPEKRREYTEKINEHLKVRRKLIGHLGGEFFGFLKTPRREEKIRKSLADERRKILDLFSEMKEEYNRDISRSGGRHWFVFFSAEKPSIVSERFSNSVDYTYRENVHVGGVVFEVKPSFHGHILWIGTAIGDIKKDISEYIIAVEKGESHYAYDPITPHKVDFRYILRIYTTEANIGIVKSKLREAGLSIDVQPFDNQPEIHKRMFEELQRIYEETHEKELEKAKREISEIHQEELEKASEEIRETHERELEEAKEEIEKMAE